MEITLTQNKDPSIASASPGDVWGFGVGELGRPNLGPMGAEKSFCCPSNTAEGCADEAHYSTEGGFTVQCDHSCGERHSSAIGSATGGTTATGDTASSVQLVGGQLPEEGCRVVLSQRGELHSASPGNSHARGNSPLGIGASGTGCSPEDRQVATDSTSAAGEAKYIPLQLALRCNGPAAAGPTKRGPAADACLKAHGTE